MDDKEKEKAEDQHQQDIKGAVTAAVSSALGEGYETREYDHGMSEVWIKRICELTIQKLQEKYSRPVKYVVTCTIARNMAPKENKEVTQKDGKDKVVEKQGPVASAGLHLCTSCYYGQSDGVFSLKADAAQKMHIVTTVFWTTFS